MHILSIALKNDVDLMRDYISLDGIDIMTYEDFKTIFLTCTSSVSDLVYEAYHTSDECHAAAIKYMKDRNKLTRKRLVDISNIPKEDLKDIIESNLAVFSTYHIIDDIPIEYIDLISPDMVDEDELVFILPLSSRDEIVTILDKNPSLSCLFGPYLSCTLSIETNLNVLREHNRIIEVNETEDNEIFLDDQEDTALEIYMKTGLNKEDIIPEYEDTVCLESLEDIKKIYDLGQAIYNKLDIVLDMQLRLIPDEYFIMLNSFNGLFRSIECQELKDTIKWFKYINNAEIEGFLNYSHNESIDDYSTLRIIWSKYYSNVQLNKIVLTLVPKDIIATLEPKVDDIYLQFL